MEIRSGFAAGWKLGGGCETAADANARWMLFTGTTGTPARINRVHRDGVPAVPAGDIACHEKLNAEAVPRPKSVSEIKPNLANI